MRKKILRLVKILFIVFCAIILIGSISGNHYALENIKNNKYINNYVGSDINVLKEFRKQYIVKIPDKMITEEVDEPKMVNQSETRNFIVTGYDLSYQSCQKSRGSSGYGITSSGFNLKGHTLTSARVIAVDPHVIPIGSKVKLIFKDEKYKKYNNVYTALDIGGRIRGNRIDLFVGDFQSSKPSKEAISFGITEASVIILDN